MTDLQWLAVACLVIGVIIGVVSAIRDRRRPKLTYGDAADEAFLTDMLATIAAAGGKLTPGHDKLLVILNDDGTYCSTCACGDWHEHGFARADAAVLAHIRHSMDMRRTTTDIPACGRVGCDRNDQHTHAEGRSA